MHYLSYREAFDRLKSKNQKQNSFRSDNILTGSERPHFVSLCVTLWWAAEKSSIDCDESIDAFTQVNIKYAAYLLRLWGLISSLYNCCGLLNCIVNGHRHLLISFVVLILHLRCEAVTNSWLSGPDVVDSDWYLNERPRNLFWTPNLF